MKYTTLPTKPGLYIDRRGDDWELTEDLEWYHYINSRPSPRPAVEKWLPFTDAPKDDEPTPPEDKARRIEYVSDIEAGDLVYFRDDPHGYQLIDADFEDCLRVSLDGSDAPSWLRGTFPDGVIVRASFFDHAERPTPSWPEPEGSQLRMYLGSDGKRYIYVPIDDRDEAPWLYVVDKNYTWSTCAWSSAEDLARKHPEALPLRELTTPEEES